MSILGLIVEYNPFHNGHLYHFNTSLHITQAEYSVCVISGNFVQRGEPAIVDKWSRTQMALRAGIDLVIEIPVIYCSQSAEYFAYGSVSLLNELGIVDNICFGSESGNINLLKNIASIISSEPQYYRDYMKQEIAKGTSFASSRAAAVVEYLRKNNSESADIIELQQILQSSNNILALEYLKWIIRLKSNINPITIQRKGSSYNDESLTSQMASATAIRKAIESNDFDSIHNHVPEFTFEILKKQFESGMGPVFPENFFQPIICMLRSMSSDSISKIMDVSEGLEHRIKRAAVSSSCVAELVENIRSKRYTETRIKRILTNTLLGISKETVLSFKEAGGLQYIRVLGFSEKGRKLLSMIKNKCPLPVITNIGDYKKYNNHYLEKMLEFDMISSDIYTSSYTNIKKRSGGYDFYKKPETL